MSAGVGALRCNTVVVELWPEPGRGKGGGEGEDEDEGEGEVEEGGQGGGGALNLPSAREWVGLLRTALILEKNVVVVQVRECSRKHTGVLAH